jgi:HTH-type transcriptional regulator/antitoxin HigA
MIRLMQTKYKNMKIKPIKSESDYEKALERLDVIFDSTPNSPEGDEAEVLAMLIENYENQHYPIDAPDPIEAIKIRMEEMNLKQKDLVGIIGGKSSVSEILNKKKKLTIEMVRELERVLQISASVLVSNYQLSK